MIYIEIDGDADAITMLSSIGFELISTHPNPYPQPYFYALMKLNTKYAQCEFIADKTFRDFIYSKISNRSLELYDRLQYAKKLEKYIESGNPLNDIEKYTPENEIPF